MHGEIQLAAVILSCNYLVSGVLLPAELLQYTISVVQYYQQQKPGQFKCMLYDLSAGTDNGWIAQLLSSPQLDSVAKYVFDENVNIGHTGSYLYKQDLTVVYVGDRDLCRFQCLFIVREFFSFLDSNSPLMVLLDTENFRVYGSIGSLLAILEFEKVTYIGTKFKKVIQMGLFGTRARTMVHFPHPKDLIRSNIRNSNRRPIRYSHIIQPWVPAIFWLKETASYLNTSTIYYSDICNTAEPTPVCIQTLLAYIDISLDHVDTFHFYRMLFGVVPISRLILVPQGRPINAIEMFTKPFAWETWVVFLLTLALIATISLVSPTLFKNDPILLVVCGFERYSLHHASTKEKVLLLPMIVFFFLMFNAYGTKMIAFMTDKPSVGNIKTLNELAKSGLKITADLAIDKSLPNDSLLGSLMVHRPIGPDNANLDGTHAHLTTDLEATLLVSMSRNYDYKLHRPRYAIINERKSTAVYGFVIGVKSPFLEILYYTQKVFFESGLFNRWHKQWEESYLVMDRKNYKSREVEHTGMLSFNDLVSLWMLLTIGLTVSVLIICLEFLLNIFKDRTRR
ncbi:hypothetical protein RP20_CCG001087 [Aedes albopictus]|nr:hypothetical protein RP20_CCG001087 [Aedes albopictus]